MPILQHTSTVLYVQTDRTRGTDWVIGSLPHFYIDIPSMVGLFTIDLYLLFTYYPCLLVHICSSTMDFDSAQFLGLDSEDGLSRLISGALLGDMSCSM
jgi:hypothetical protein